MYNTLNKIYYRTAGPVTIATFATGTGTT